MQTKAVAEIGHGTRPGSCTICGMALRPLRHLSKEIPEMRETFSQCGGGKAHGYGAVARQHAFRPAIIVRQRSLRLKIDLDDVIGIGTQDLKKKIVRARQAGGTQNKLGFKKRRFRGVFFIMQNKGSRIKFHGHSLLTLLRLRVQRKGFAQKQIYKGKTDPNL